MNINDLAEIFGNSTYPAKGLLTESQPSEWEYIYTRLRGKKWPDLSVEDIDAQGGIIEGVQCLSPDVFVYFLPGLMNLVLNDASIRYCIVTGILSRLTGPDNSPKGGQTDKEAVLTLLSSKQRQFLIEFLLDAMEHEPMLCPVVAESAIRNLRQGRAGTYCQEAVWRWVNSNPLAKAVGERLRERVKRFEPKP